MLEVPGIRSVRVNRRAGSMVVEYDREAFLEMEDRRRFWRALEGLIPGDPGSGRFVMVSKRLSGDPTLSGRLYGLLTGIKAIRHVGVDNTSGRIEVEFDPSGLSPVTLIDAFMDRR